MVARNIEAEIGSVKRQVLRFTVAATIMCDEMKAHA
jgi:hypothetical protein